MALLEFEERPLVFGVVTVSDTRTLETDKGGQRVQDLAEADGHTVAHRIIVKDEYEEIKGAVHQLVTSGTVDVVITTGGTGIAKRDVTIEAVHSLVDKEIPGFGELFRYLSFTEDIGTKAMASRAVAGVSEGVLLFATPGSVGAVTLAMSRLILPEVKHLVREIRK